MTWKPKFKYELILSIIKSYPIGNIIIKENENEFVEIDRQQRLTSIFDFISGSKGFEKIKDKNVRLEFLKYLNNFKSEYDNILTEVEKKENGIIFEKLPNIIKDAFYSYNINVTYILGETSQDEIANYFKVVQNQQYLQVGEIINAIYYYNDKLFELVSRIDNKDNFREKNFFSRASHEFYTSLINIIGLYNKLSI